MSLDTIANCAFGIDTNSFQAPDNVLFKRCVQAFTDLQLKNMGENVMFHTLNYFPFLFEFLDAYGKENYSFLRLDLTHLLTGSTGLRTKAGCSGTLF